MLVEIPDEIYAELKRMGTALQTQDNRCTADPYFYQVRDIKKTWGINQEYSNEGFCWLNNFGDEAISDKQVESENYKEYLVEIIADNELDISYCSEIEDEETPFFENTEDYILTILNTLSVDDLEQILKESDYSKVYYRKEPVYSNIFFDEKSIKDHINSNRHHYSKDVNDYISYAFRNPDMEAIIKFLRGL